MLDSLRATDREDIVFSLYHIWYFGVSLAAVSPEDTYGLPCNSLGVHPDLTRIHPSSVRSLHLQLYLFHSNHPQNRGFDLGIPLCRGLSISYFEYFRLPE
jgi:hypothetical protein